MQEDEKLLCMPLSFGTRIYDQSGVACLEEAGNLI
jgi:hypothetical protein